MWGGGTPKGIQTLTGEPALSMSAIATLKGVEERGLTWEASEATCLNTAKR